MREPYQEWRSPRPLWSTIGNATATAERAVTMARPSLLRFDTDTFMDDFVRVLERDPAQLEGFVAKPETWRRPSQVPAGVRALLEAAGPLTIGERRRAATSVANGNGTSSDGSGGNGADGATGVSAEAASGSDSGPLKLYQPAHGRYYLVTSSLVCRLVGLPDRRVDPVRDERAAFVVRRLVPAESPTSGEASAPGAGTWNEHAFVKTGAGYRWECVGDTAGGGAAVVVDGEERNPLFASRFSDDSGSDRRVFAGLVPVGAREAYMGAPLGRTCGVEDGASGAGAAGGAGNGTTPGSAAAPASPGLDPRIALFRTQVLEPWRALIRQARAALGVVTESRAGFPEIGPPADGDAAVAGAVDTLRSQIQTGSWYILLELADFLRTELPEVWADVESPSAGAPPAGSVLEALEMAAETGPGFPDGLAGSPPVAASLAAALRSVTAGDVWSGTGRDATLVASGATRRDLEAVVAPYDRGAPDPLWPDVLFPLVDVDDDLELTGGEIVLEPDSAILAAEAGLAALRDAVERDLVLEPAEGSYPDLPPSAPEPLDRREGWFVIRCVFERPNCGPLKPPLVGAATVPFRMAPFFDPDAPARRIRIPMPIDTTPAGLRKFAKNTVFEFSSVLCGQVEALRSFTFMDLVLSVLPWPFHKPLDVGKVGVCTDDGDECGVACSLSIPIVTICALILLIMIVTLLDQIFKWIPFFIACFRIPGFKGKSA